MGSVGGREFYWLVFCMPSKGFRSKPNFEIVGAIDERTWLSRDVGRPVFFPFLSF